MTYRLAVALAAVFFVATCHRPGSQTGCDSHFVAIDWVNFIEVGSTQYLWGTVETTELQESDLGPVYAHVKFKASDNVCDPNYRPKDGDAAFLDAGTPIYEVKGRPPSEQLAARFNSRILLYVVVTKGPPPVPGGTPSP